MIRSLRLWGAQHARMGAISTALGDLLGTDVEVRLRRVQPLAQARAMPDAVGVALAASDAPEVAQSGLIEAERALTVAVVARAIRRKPPAVTRPASRESPEIVGAFAAVVAAVARRAHAGVALRVLAAGPGAALESDLERVDPELVAATLTVLVADEAYEARVVVPRAALNSAPPHRWDSEALAALGGTPLSLPLVACVTASNAAELGALRPGDVFLPGAWRLTRSGDGVLIGPVVLAAPPADFGISARLGEDGALVLGGDVEPLCWAEEGMGDPEEKGALVTAIGDVPVVVRVELGEARMPARDWAVLGRGDVVSLGRRVAERVVLRVGGVAVAWGELVEIEGEVGVRIIERIPVERTAT